MTGGYVYRGTALPARYQGRYFFGDYGSGRVWSLGLAVNADTREAALVDEIEHTDELGGTKPGLSSFARDLSGEIYLVTQGGDIYRRPPTSLRPARPTSFGRESEVKPEPSVTPRAGCACESSSPVGPAHNRRSMSTTLAALLIGVVAGMRAMIAPAAVSWAAALGWIPVGATVLGFLANRFTPWVFTLLALGEFVTDQLPTTPSRTVPLQFGTRLVSGALSGGAIGLSGGGLAGGAIAGVLGAVLGTLGGRWLRGRLAASFGSDRPAAFLEDALAVGLALLALMWL